MKEKDVLSLIKTPSDVKKLNRRQLKALAEELRALIIGVTTRNGGHLASGLGVVELTLALHRVFSLPSDSIVWDVGHQTYVHKILTHGKEAFLSLRRKGGLSGFSRPDESRYDAFVSGHASNSISAALGLLEADRLAGRKNKTVAVIGDGALTGGMTFEGFNHAGFLKRDLIVVLNDNAMSIGKNVGALSSHTRKSFISSIITGFGVCAPVFHIRYAADRFLPRIPIIGRFLFHLRKRILNALKALFLKENLFSNFGFVYVGPIDGHNEARLEKILKRVKRLPVPTVVHVLTKKGKGLPEAEADPARYHGVAGSGAETPSVSGKSYTTCFSEWMVQAAERCGDLVGISAAMTEGCGLAPFAARFPERFYDTGITEEHAVTFAAGLAKGGRHPVVAIYSTFMQRAVDQVIHDTAIQDLPVIFVADRAGLVGGDGETHQGIFDVSIYRSVPRLEIFMPSTEGVLRSVLDYALASSHPVLIRLAKDVCPPSAPDEEPFVPGRGAFAVLRKNSEQLVISCGALLPHCLRAAEEATRKGFATDVYDFRSLKPFDADFFLDAVKNYDRVFLFEENMSFGGVGEALAPLFAGRLKPRFEAHGLPQCFPQHASRRELLDEFGLSAEAMEARLTASVGEAVR